MSNPFEILVGNLNNLGFFGFLLPWLLTFTVFFGLLAKSKVLGEDKRIDGVVSLVAAFFVIGFGGPAIGEFFKSLFTLAAVVLTGILVVALFLGMSGANISNLTQNKSVLYAVAGIGIIVFFTAAGALGIRVSNETVSILVVLIIMAMGIVFITGSGGK